MGEIELSYLEIDCYIEKNILWSNIWYPRMHDTYKGKPKCIYALTINIGSVTLLRVITSYSKYNLVQRHMSKSPQTFLLGICLYCPLCHAAS